jgi:hypothetical protein
MVAGGGKVGESWKRRENLRFVAAAMVFGRVLWVAFNAQKIRIKWASKGWFWAVQRGDLGH